MPRQADPDQERPLLRRPAPHELEELDEVQDIDEVGSDDTAGLPVGQLPPWRRRLLELQEAVAIDRWAQVAELQQAGRWGEAHDFAYRQDLVTVFGDAPGPAALEQERLVREAGGIVDAEVQRRADQMLAGQRVADVRAERDRLLREVDEIDQHLLDLRASTEERVLAEQFSGRSSVELSDDEHRQFRIQAATDPVYTSERQRLQEQRDANWDRRVALIGEFQAAEQRETRAQRAALLEVLSQHRPMGAATGRRPWGFVDRPGQASDPDVQGLLERGARFWPRTWIEASNRQGPLHAQRRGERGYCQNHRDGSCDIVVSARGGSKHADDPAELPVVIHEEAHRMEKVITGVTAMEWAFYRRRTVLRPSDPSHSRQSAPVPLPKLLRGCSYGPEEIARKDRFGHPYMGKDYGNARDSHYELLSMGSESVWTGSYQPDAEHRRLVLGLFALL
jgi:hypothetical protein